MSQLPLEDIRVTDVTASWAGPYLTNMMGTLGAEIIKVDSLQRLDIWRPSATQLLSPRDKVWEWSPNWNAVNTDKLCITLNLTDPRGVDVFKRLASISDVVAENYTPRVMPNFGLDYPVLRGCFQSLRLVLDLMYETQTIPQRPYRRTVGHSASLTPASQAWRTAAHGGYT